MNVFGLSRVTELKVRLEQKLIVPLDIINDLKFLKNERDVIWISIYSLYLLFDQTYLIAIQIVSDLIVLSLTERLDSTGLVLI